MNLQDAIAKAAALFKAFHQRAATTKDVRVVSLDQPEACLYVGPVTRIAYKADGKEYIHKFGSNRPLLYVSSDGRQAYILKGGYRFTDRGFIG